MKKLLFVLALLMIFAGVANAASIPLAVDPYNYPEIWTTEAYNNSGGALGSGTVVVWDFNSVSSPAAYTDRLNYFTTSATADDIRVAGVIADDVIPASSTGTIVIRGPFYVRTADSTDAVTASQSVAVSTIRGMADQASAAAVNKGILGWCIYAADNTVANGGYATTDGADGTRTVIFIQPSNN